TIARGFLFRLIQLAGGTWIAIVISSALFGLAHAFNPGASFTSTLAIALEAGVLLAAAFIVTRRLWLPIGIHAGWNFAEGSLFGMAVSGGHSRSSLLAGALKGPVILTGGEFGPEASVVAIAVCLAAAAFLLRRSSRLGLLIRPPWSRP
ncbi:MAG: lysostaphin resistance A-like protein, partial [Candidatus Acidiferrales bacterium]